MILKIIFNLTKKTILENEPFLISKISNLDISEENTNLNSNY